MLGPHLLKIYFGLGSCDSICHEDQKNSNVFRTNADFSLIYPANNWKDKIVGQMTKYLKFSALKNTKFCLSKIWKDKVRIL